MQFDPTSAQPETPSGGGFDPGTAQPDSGQSGGILKNIGASIEEGMTGLPGAVMDAVMHSGPVGDAISAVPLMIKSAVTGKIPTGPEVNTMLHPGQTATHTLNKGLGLIGLNPEDVTANTPGERIARVAGAGTLAAFAPEAEAPELADALGQQVISRFANAPIATTARKLATGVASGVGAGTAAEAVPDDHPALKQAVEVLGSIAGGAAAEAPALTRAVAPAVKKWAQPFTAPGQSQMAGDIIRGRVTDPAAVQSILEIGRDHGPGDQEIVTGSQPTTFQQTGDTGLGQLEREQATKSPAPFIQRRADQNAARQDALTSIQAGGDPDAVGTFLRGQFRNFDDQTQQHIDALTAHAQQQTEGLGGSGVPEEHGAALRGVLQQAETSARARERSLWQAVDPDRNLVMPTQPTVQAAQDIMGGLSPSAKPMAGEEAAIFDLASNYQPQMPFADLSDLRSRTSTAMREELIHNGATPAYARLSRLRGAIQNNLADAATNQAAQDAQAVSSGAITHDQAIGGKLQGWVNDFYGRRAAQAGTGSGAGFDASAARGSASDLGADGTGLPPSGRSGSPAGNQGVPSGPQPFDQPAADRLAEATQATKQRAQTFNQGPAKQVLAKAGTQDVYRLPEARVPEKYFHAGPTSFSDIQGLRQTVGDEAALPILQDYAAASLRKAAENADGTLNPGKVAAWQTKYGNALRAFPELSDRFSTAADASNAIVDAAAARRTAIADRNSSAIGKVMNAQNADDVTKTVGGIFGKANSAQAMQQVAQAASRSPEAIQGLRQAVADHIANNFISNTEAGTSGVNLFKSDAYQTFLKKNRGALAQVFSPEEMDTFDRIGADLKRANRSIVASKLPGGSNTAQDMHGIIANDPNATVLDHAISEGAAAIGGAAVGHLPGAFLAAMGARVSNAVRAAGLRKVNDLITEAMLNPDLARDLLRRAPSQSNSGQSVALASRLRRIAMAAAATRLGPQKPNGFAKGGRTHESDAGKTVPESTETLRAQQDQLVHGLRPAMMFPWHGKTTNELPIPREMRRTVTREGVFHFDPKKTSVDEIKAASKANRLNTVLSLGPHSKAEVMRRVGRGERPLAVTERRPDGTEVRAAAGTHGTAPAQMAHFERTKTPGNRVQPEDAASVVRDRLAAAP